MSGLFSRMRIARLCLAAAVPLITAGAAMAESAPLRLERTTLDATGDAPELCLHFDQPLQNRSQAELAGAIRLAPDAHSTVRVQERALCLGGLAFNQRYQVTVGTGILSAGGGHLAAPVTLAARFGNRPAHVAIAGDGFILPGHATAGLTVQSVNVRDVRVHVFRMQPHMRFPGTGENGGPPPDLGETTLWPWTFDALVRQSVSEVWHGTMAIDGPAGGIDNRTAETAFPLADIVGRQGPGLYLVTAEDAAVAPASSPVETALRAARGQADRSTGNYGDARQIASHWVNLSDLGMTMLRGEDGLTVSVRSLASGLPVAGAVLSLRGRDGGILATAHTDKGGAARFAAPLLRGRAAHEPVLLVAEQDNDYGFLRLDRQWFDFSDHPAAGPTGHGRPADAGTGDLRALVQADRGLYRPGETVRLLVLMRDRAGRAAHGLHPILVLRRPDMTQDRTLPLADDQDGGYAVTLPLNTSAPQGQWKAEIHLDPTMPSLGTAGFAVRDFIPQVIATDFATPASVTAGQPVTIDATVRFLYGAPGVGLKTDSRYRVVPASDPLPHYRGWSFGLENEDMASIGGDIDAPPAGPDGHARLTFTPEIPPGLTRPLAIALNAGFLDPTGRRVGDERLIAIRRTTPLIGLHVAPRNGSGGESGPTPVDIALLAPDDHPVPGTKLHWAVSRLNRIYNWSHEDGAGWTFTSHVIDVPMRAGEIVTDARGLARVSPVLDWGEYRLTATEPTSGAATSMRFTVGWADRADDAGTPDRLPLSVRDAQVAPGGGTVLHIGGGFAGQAQVTLATDHVLSVQTVTVPKDGLSVPLTATADWQSGIYALVTLYRPLAGPGAGPMRPHDPVRAVGLAWIGVDQARHHLAVALDAPQTVTPRRRMTIPVVIQASGGAPAGKVHLAVAAVDQGILNLTHFHPLDMFDVLFGQQLLGLDMLDNYGALLLGDARTGRIRSGGDASGGEEESGPPIRTRASVALFDGPIALDTSGHGSVSFDVPDFDGQLHLMATAWNDDAIGNAERDVIARDQVFPDLGLPRFMAPGDSAQALVTLVDTTAPAGTYTVELSTNGPLRLAGAGTFTADLVPGARRETRLPVTAGPAGMGGADAHVHLTLRRAGHAAPLLEREWPITIRPGHMPVTVSDGAWLPAGGRRTIGRAALAGFDAADTRTTLGLSASAGIDTIGLLQALPAHPWGPSDSMAAQARALLQVTDPAMLGPHETAVALHDRVQAVIDTLFDRQNAAGTIGQFQADDGRTLPDDQDGIADFLIRAKAAGYVVSPDRLDLTLGQIDAEQIQAMPFAGGRAPRLASLNTRAYAAYVLARAGRLHPDTIRGLAASLVARTQQDHTTLLWTDAESGNAQAAPQALGHLAAALRLADMPDDGGATAPGGLFDAAIAALGPERTGPPAFLDAGYWAYVRDLASLAALAAEAHDDTRARLLIARFGKLTIAPDSLAEQSRTALLEAAQAMEQDTAGRAVRVDGQALPAPLHLPAIRALTPAMLDRGVVVDNTGRKPLFATLTRHGVPDGDATQAANGLTLEATGYTLDGKPLDLAHMRLNDRFIISLKGTAARPGSYQVGLTSLLPAGWEIESAIAPSDAAPDRADDDAHGEPTPYAFLGPLTQTDSAAIRDDRLTADLRFDTRPPRLALRGFQVAYIARATMPGHFIRPEAVVSARFNPSLMARTASGVVDIAPR